MISKKVTEIIRKKLIKQLEYSKEYKFMFEKKYCPHCGSKIVDITKYYDNKTIILQCSRCNIKRSNIQQR